MDDIERLSGGDYLDSVLQRSGAAGGGHVRDVAIVSDQKTLLSRIIRLRLDYDGAADGAPVKLVLKTVLPERAGAEWSGGQQEVAFYRDAAPWLPAGIVPRCFVAEQGDASVPPHLLLEDLTETHHLATQWPLPPSDAQCRTIVAALARFHAVWWDDPRLGKTIGQGFSDAARDRFLQQVAQHFRVFADSLGDEFSAERRDFYETLIAALPRLHMRYREGGNITLTHGDAHVWNCFLPRNGGEDARWFDWDCWRIRSATNDLAYMIAVHWYPERRRLFENALLDHYHGALTGCGIGRYSRADLQADYRLSVLLLAITPVFQAGLKIPPVVWWNNFQRVMAAVDDLGCRELLD